MVTLQGCWIKYSWSELQPRNHVAPTKTTSYTVVKQKVYHRTHPITTSGCVILNHADSIPSMRCTFAIVKTLRFPVPYYSYLHKSLPPLLLDWMYCTASARFNVMRSSIIICIRTLSSVMAEAKSARACCELRYCKCWASLYESAPNGSDWP